MESIDEFIGIDWSGSRSYTRSRGEHPIQVARIDRDGHLEVVPESHRPRWNNRWTRTHVVDYLDERIRECASQVRRVLIGVDFAFSFPFLADGVLPGLAGSPETWVDLMAMICSTVGRSNDFYPMPFVEREEVVPYFRVDGNTGRRYEQRFRVTECKNFLCGQDPASVFNLVGAKQVGRGSIAGIACLHELRSRNPDAIHVWPFDGVDVAEDKTAVIVEVWPRLLYELVGVPPVSYRYPRVFNMALEWYGASNAGSFPASGENVGDALITAAALRHFADHDAFWDAPHRLAPAVSGVEGWIWGADSSSLGSTVPGEG